MDEILNLIRDYADNAHGTQQRKHTPERYIVHPIRVMETCRNFGATLPMLAAALLHDVLEDTPIIATELLEFLRSIMDADDALKTLSLVEQLTDVYVKSDFPQLNRRTRKSKELERILDTTADAQTIKYADILDNSQEIAEGDPDFAPRYLRESLAILRKADKGNPDLRKVAIELVEDKLAKLS